MQESALTLDPRWLALVLVCAVPFLLSAIGLAVHQLQSTRRRGGWLPVAAGPWLEQQVDDMRLDVGVEVHAHHGLDAYWPSVGAIGLSERTWGGCRPTDWAIAAHELGHALNMASHPVVAQILPTARLAQGHLWRAFVATLLCAALLQHSVLLLLAPVLLLASVVVTFVVCLDELFASRHGLRLLHEDPRVRAGQIRVARVSMTGAASVYGLGLIGQVAVLGAWPAIRSWVLGLSLAPVQAPGALVMWLTVVLVPVLLLRAAQVSLQVMDPEPVTSDFRLFTVMHRDGQWEFLTGIGVLVIVVGLHPMFGGTLGAVAMVLATMTAIGPVGGLMSALILFPVLLLARGWFERSEDDDEAFFPAVTTPDQSAPALMALYTDPPWYLRASWLAHVAYLPLLGVLAVRLLA